MSPYAEAWRLLELNGIDPAKLQDRCAEFGFVHMWPDGLIWAEYMGHKRNALVIWIALGKNCLQRFCELAPAGLERVAFARGLRGQWEFKEYSFERIKRLCKTTTSSALGPRAAR